MLENNNLEHRPKVGIGVMVFKDGKVLLGKRRGSHDMGEHSLPGGHLEYMESFEECARREVKEETGLEIENVKFLILLNSKQYTPKHYVEIGFTADYKSGTPTTLEPEKIGDWEWYDINHFPEHTFSKLPNYLEAYKTGKRYYDN